MEEVKDGEASKQGKTISGVILGSQTNSRSGGFATLSSVGVGGFAVATESGGFDAAGTGGGGLGVLASGSKEDKKSDSPSMRKQELVDPAVTGKNIKKSTAKTTAGDDIMLRKGTRSSRIALNTYFSTFTNDIDNPVKIDCDDEVKDDDFQDPKKKEMVKKLKLPKKKLEKGRMEEAAKKTTPKKILGKESNFQLAPDSKLTALADVANNEDTTIGNEPALQEMKKSTNDKRKEKAEEKKVSEKVLTKKSDPTGTHLVLSETPVLIPLKNKKEQEKIKENVGENEVPMTSGKGIGKVKGKKVPEMVEEKEKSEQEKIKEKAAEKEVLMTSGKGKSGFFEELESDDFANLETEALSKRNRNINENLKDDDDVVPSFGFSKILTTEEEKSDELVVSPKPVSSAGPIVVYDENKTRPKRKIVLSDFLRSPYVQRPVVIKASRTKLENEISEFVFSATLTHSDIVFKTKEGENVARHSFESLCPGIEVHLNVISAWSRQLNYQEKFKKKESPTRLFLFSKYAGDDIQEQEKATEKEVSMKSGKKELEYVPYKGYVTSCRASPKQFVSMIDNLNEEQRKTVKDMGFESLLSMGVKNVPTGLGLWLITNYDEDNNTLNIGTRKLNVSALQVSEVLGVPRGNEKGNMAREAK
ncbi:hypothetical protein SSX86_016643 [Deinandra increscens subsp. villosa]|uniref:Uncharacterized protein n=1 Tax=Deinandra increscens subsp. villosa TaxID=3103831 RepID=A0AAP0CYE7_9ASTR